ncbi:enoyl-CoA hydratase/isomerase family protein [Paraliomyxa miuraensis]|uniref:enoyl-CoA hydratase/isomerase family protein n=1 Tax=Paraliomyxa miuraensis TaxID=376150 RepID=UPI00225414E8|nr:enoyl-CoA hydratase/isomerase family protein [Paraliomyxa miuraensis]MCX4247945.1 enoyl-CoA hydratase/isomerase family protein [Paraliomyxa miuraensis]
MDLGPIAALHPTLDSPRRLLVLQLEHGKANEMGSEQLDALAALCTLLEADPSVSCLCTTSRRVSSKGKPIFIAGANVTERVGWDDDRVKAHVLRQRELMRRLRRLPLFHVVLSHGVTLGWGAEYVLTADYALATPTASFGLPETGLGILPGARGTAELALLVGPAQALRLGCTGETIDAAEAHRIGLVQELVSDVDAGLARVQALADHLCKRSPTAVAAFKQALLDGLGQPEAVRLDLERRAYEHTVDTGEAAIGRASFAAIRDGQVPAWGPRR